MTVAAAATTALDLNLLVRTFGLEGAAKVLAPYAGQTVTYVSKHDGTRMTGRFAVRYCEATEWSAAGFTLNVTGDNGDFLATGAWDRDRTAPAGTYDWDALDDQAWVVVPG